MQDFSHISFRGNWDYTKNSLYYLGQINATMSAISITPLLPDYHRQLLHISLQKGARATTAIEGNTLTEEEIEEIQNGKSLPPSKEYQEIEVKNILEAYTKIRNDIILENKSDLISPDLIKRFNYMVGKNLGEHFGGNPGQFRSRNVFVGTYKAPDYEDVPELINKLCKFLRNEFHYDKGQKFGSAIIEAIITHVYLEWIHPFEDGNGRTGRLLEFYLLLRAGNPDIASHVLSNHYNNTRIEYYRQLDKANKSGNLSEFIEYALLGFRDGLMNIITIIQTNLLTIAWQKLVYDMFSDINYRVQNVFKRKRRTLLHLPIFKELSMDEIFFQNAELSKEYASLSKMTLKRELEEFLQMKLLVKSDGDKYRANIGLLVQQSPLRKITNNIYDGF
ncbi:MAG: Fic family protein [Ignavibacteriaceae bacterium]|nr:Fic family protein [Ignavibacteriaceae bacterium]